MEASTGRAHVNSLFQLETALLLPFLGYWLAAFSVFCSPPLGLYWDSNSALVHECINLYDTSYAVGYFSIPLSIPDKYFYFTKHFVIFPSTFPVCFTKFGLCLWLGVDLLQTSVTPR